MVSPVRGYVMRRWINRTSFAVRLATEMSFGERRCVMRWRWRASRFSVA